MATQPPDPEIEQLLAELRSDDPKRRQTAADKVAKRKLDNDEIIKVLNSIAETDTNWYAQYAAKSALVSLGVRAVPVKVLSRRAKIAQFTIGFAGWYLVNGALWLPVGGKLYAPGSDALICNALFFPANLLALIVLARTVRWVAWGMLSAIALNLLIALMIGVATSGVCFIPFFVH